MTQVMKTLLAAGLLTAVSQAATLADLKHRWSFNGDLTDSVGGVTAVTAGTASVLNNQLELPGGTARTNNASIAIGSTIASTQSLTVETWFTLDTVANWSKVMMFGNDDAHYIDFTPNAGDGQTPSASFKNGVGTNETNTRDGTNPSKLVAGQTVAAAIVWDATADTISIYLNGALADTHTGWTGAISDLGSTSQNYIGSAVGFGDGDLDGRVDEFRVWTTALSGTEIASNFTAGPNAVAVPEASTAALGLLGGLALLRRRRA